MLLIYDACSGQRHVLLAALHQQLAATEGEAAEIAGKHARLFRLIHAYRARGHRIAGTNPLEEEVAYYPEVDPAHYDFGHDEMDEMKQEQENENNEDDSFLGHWTSDNCLQAVSRKPFNVSMEYYSLHREADE